MAREKTEGPAQSITFLGITVDTAMGQLRLPQDKLSRLRSKIAVWSSHRRCRKLQLLSLIGHLTHAATVVPPGRPFVRHMIETPKKATKPHHFIMLDRGFHSDLAWWTMFLHRWNGVSIMRGQKRDIVITSDALGTWGCGAFSGTQWLQLQWPPCWAAYSIAPSPYYPCSSCLGKAMGQEDSTLPLRQHGHCCMPPQGFSQRRAHAPSSMLPGIPGSPL